jgi:hypothetical protein
LEKIGKKLEKFFFLKIGKKPIFLTRFHIELNLLKPERISWTKPTSNHFAHVDFCMDATYPNYKILVSDNNNSAVSTVVNVVQKLLFKFYWRHVASMVPMRPLKFVNSNLCRQFGQDIEDLSKRLFSPFHLKIFDITETSNESQIDFIEVHSIISIWISLEIHLDVISSFL